MSSREKIKILRHRNALFPTHPVREENDGEVIGAEVPLFAGEVLMLTVNSMQNKKAPGPHGIMAKVLKVEAPICLQLHLNMYNKRLEAATFRGSCEIQGLVSVNQ